MARKPVTPVQVQQYQTLRVVKIDSSATYGAQIGVDLLMPDGTVATTAKLQSLFGNDSQTINGPTTTDDLQEGKFNFYFTDKRAQSAVGDILTNTATIHLTYDGTGNTIKADLVGFGSLTTNNLTEGGTNLYFTKPRVASALVEGTGIQLTVDIDGNTTIALAGATGGLLEDWSGSQLADWDGGNLEDWVTILPPTAWASYTLALLPDPTTSQDTVAICTDSSSGRVPVWCDGTDWLLFSDNSVVS